jgi:diadenosine tetraphosphate (Ap4A) HIT family hydrolase
MLLPDPVVDSFNVLSQAQRAAVMQDAANLGDALLHVTGALRINYAIFGNLEPALHVHVIPRYVDEPEALRTAQPWAYDWQQAPKFSAVRDSQLLVQLRAQLERGRP